MKWVTYRSDHGERTGVLSGDAIYAMPPDVSLLDLVGRGADGLRTAGERAVRSPAAVVALDEVTLAAPIPRPPSIRDSLCFLDHMRNCQEAMGGGRVLMDTWYRIPAFYFACPSTVLGPYDDAPTAPGSAWQDFELEIAAVIGTSGKDLTVEQAERSIIGYTIFNDWSARDLQMLEGQLRIGQAKGKDSGITLGPYLVTPDELEPYCRGGKLSLRVIALVNGTVIGSGSTAQMDWSFGEVIAYASRGVTLTPGDVFGSGTVPTCTLVEHLRPPESFPGWLHDGDVSPSRSKGWARRGRPSGRAALLFRWLFGRIRTPNPTGAGSTRHRRGCRLPAGCTKSPTGYGRGRCPTGDTASATPGWSPGTARRCSWIPCSTWH